MLRDSLFAETRCKDSQCSSKQWSVEMLLNSTDYYLTFNVCWCNYASIAAAWNTSIPRASSISEIVLNEKFTLPERILLTY